MKVLQCLEVQIVKGENLLIKTYPINKIKINHEFDTDDIFTSDYKFNFYYKGKLIWFCDNLNILYDYEGKTFSPEKDTEYYLCLFSNGIMKLNEKSNVHFKYFECKIYNGKPYSKLISIKPFFDIITNI